MANEKKDEGAGDPIKILLEEVATKERDDGQLRLNPSATT